MRKIKLNKVTNEEAYTMLRELFVGTMSTADFIISVGCEDHKEEFPPEMFAVQYGFDLSTKWDIPFGFSEHSLGCTLRNYLHKILDRVGLEKGGAEILSELYKEALELNPMLKRIKIRSQSDAFEVLFGMVSRFGYDDIKFYLEVWSEARDSNMEEWRRLRADLDKFGKKYEFQWVLSPMTRIKIENHFREINKN